MILSDEDIRIALAEGEFSVDPWDERLLQPASFDLRLDAEFLTMRPAKIGFIDPAVDQTDDLYERHCASGSFFVHPGEFIIASSIERIRLGDSLVGRLEGKSSLGRLGLVVHVTAGFFDPGFEGQATLEMANLSQAAIRLYVGMPIAQFSLTRLYSKSVKPYEGKYKGQTGPQPSAYWKNFLPGGIMGPPDHCSGGYHTGPWKHVPPSDSVEECEGCGATIGK